MTAFFLDPAMSAALWIIVKATALLGVAAIVEAAMYRRTSAATRHLVWTLAVVGVLLLPILSLALPQWAVVTRTATTEAADQTSVMDTVERAAAPARPSSTFVAHDESALVARPAAAALFRASPLR